MSHDVKLQANANLVSENRAVADAAVKIRARQLVTGQTAATIGEPQAAVGILVVGGCYSCGRQLQHVGIALL